MSRATLAKSFDNNQICFPRLDTAEGAASERKARSLPVGDQWGDPPWEWPAATRCGGVEPSVAAIQSSTVG